MDALKIRQLRQIILDSAHLSAAQSALTSQKHITKAISTMI